MSLSKYREVAIKYRVEDLPNALRPGTPVSNVLRDLELGEKPISDIAQSYLKRMGLLVLLRYARKEVSFAEYLEAAEIEQSERRLAAEAKALEEQAQQKSRDEAMQVKLRQMEERAAARKRAFDNDPKNIAKAKQVQLRRKYALSHFIEKADFPKLMTILRRVDNCIRLSDDEIVWLRTEGEEYFTQELRKGFHLNEAFSYEGEFKENKDPWSAVNASSHYRKCGKAKSADLMLSTIDVSILKNSKLKSAIYTTQGGVKRDLKKWDEALCLGERAHRLASNDFRPCTLLGAVNTEMGHYDLGRSWYAKAVERGYSEEAVDDELRGIFMRMEKSKQEALRNYLLTVDSARYSWAKKKVP
jgi:hypothetical protein